MIDAKDAEGVQRKKGKGGDTDETDDSDDIYMHTDMRKAPKSADNTSNDSTDSDGHKPRLRKRFARRRERRPEPTQPKTIEKFLKKSYNSAFVRCKHACNLLDELNKSDKTLTPKQVNDMTTKVKMSHGRWDVHKMYLKLSQKHLLGIKRVTTFLKNTSKQQAITAAHMQNTFINNQTKLGYKPTKAQENTLIRCGSVDRLATMMLTPLNSASVDQLEALCCSRSAEATPFIGEFVKKYKIPLTMCMFKNMLNVPNIYHMTEHLKLFDAHAKREQESEELRACLDVALETICC